MNSSNHSSTPYFINKTVENRSTSNRIDRIIDTLEDIINTFKTHGCPEGKQLLHEVLIRNHLLGGSPLEAARQGWDVTRVTRDKGGPRK